MLADGGANRLGSSRTAIIATSGNTPMFSRLKMSVSPARLASAWLDGPNQLSLAPISLTQSG